jgi:DNA-binding CsgD family transcriptional regulator
MPLSELVGREAEIAAVHGFLHNVSSGPVALVLEGEPGIGKTTIWRAGVHAAPGHGIEVLQCRPAQAEAKFSFAGLVDLMAGIPPASLAVLPEPQSRALAAAALQVDPGGHGGIDQRAVSTGFLSLLRSLAADRPLMICVDDAQWLDGPTRRVLEFAIRRLRSESIGVLVTHLSNGLTRASLGLEEGLPQGRRDRMTIGPLNLGELHSLIRCQLGRVPPRPVLVRIEQASGGNPFYALEIARALALSRPALLPGGPLPFPPSLHGVLAQRLTGLPARSREALLLCALASSPTIGMLVHVMGPAAEQAVGRLELSGIIDIDGTAIRFAHPLFAAAAANKAGGSNRRGAHCRLADVAADLEERARHLALSTDGPDEAVAEALELAARAALARGATDAAAELMQLALGVTPDGMPDRRSDRALILGEYLLLAGDTNGARSHLEGAVISALTASTRARARMHLAQIAWLTGSSVEAEAIGNRALEDAAGDMLEAEIRTQLADLCKHDRRKGLAHAERAVSILEARSDPDDALLGRARFAVIDNGIDLGHPLRLDDATNALGLEAIHPPARVANRISYRLGNILCERDQLDAARPYLEASLRVAADEGDEGSTPTILDQLSQLEVLAGNWPLARRYAQEQLESAARADQEMEALWAAETLASIDAHEGNIEAAEAGILEMLARARRVDDAMTVAFGLRTLGFISLLSGRPRAACTAFDEAHRISEEIGVLSPAALRLDGYHIEVLIALGEQGRAIKVLGRLEERGQHIDSPWALVVAERSRAQFAAAGGEFETASQAAAGALAAALTLGMPFELGRTYLVRGQIQRRRKAKRAARASFGEALAIFEGLEARLFADRSRAELARVGLRPPAPLELTETERQVAELVAAGLTNREAGVRLFISPKTVEGNLARVYRKIGVRNRAELATKLTASAARDGVT